MKLETYRIYFALRFCFISSNSKFDFQLWCHFLVTEWASSILLGLGSTPGKDRPTKPGLGYISRIDLYLFGGLESLLRSNQ